jgi:hypothetical protein
MQPANDNKPTIPVLKKITTAIVRFSEEFLEDHPKVKESYLAGMYGDTRN